MSLATTLARRFGAGLRPGSLPAARQQDEARRRDGPSARPETALDLAEANRRERAAKARLAEMKLAQLRGELLPRAEVERIAFETFRVFRDRILSVPDRIAAQIASLADTSEVHEVMISELRQALSAGYGDAAENGAEPPA